MQAACNQYGRNSYCERRMHSHLHACSLNFKSASVGWMTTSVLPPQNKTCHACELLIRCEHL